MNLPSRVAWLRAALLAGLATLAACSKQPPADVSSSSGLPTNATAVDRLIAQARDAIGPANKLDGLFSVKMAGKIYNEKGDVLAVVNLAFSKPANSFSDIKTATGDSIKGSDGFLGWSLQTDLKDNRRLSMLKAPEEEQEVNAARENLFFYHAIDLVPGGEVHDDGETDYRGTKCHKLTFKYPNGITYVRYLDCATGKLRGTIVLPVEAEVVESGEISAGGINFPAVLTSYTKDGKVANIVKFEKIVVNDKIDPRNFQVPDLVALVKQAKAAAAKASASASAKASGSGLSLLPAKQP